MIRPGERTRLAVVVWSVLLSQTFLYPGLADLIAAVAAPAVRSITLETPGPSL
ncbi:MFS family permease [Halapricum desulfuricans]|uniref:MFS family permease n=1 Tax=Halapricum desulfuricans TaxID=2841257 RepID=A0A897NI44_9EURY|nr:hypothetical protein [Halapricum desulfuricans]QSG10569.1 MFS family permease [Halapricum desulfuricans]